MLHFIKQYSIPVLAMVLALSLWQLMAEVEWVNPHLMPPPSKIARAFTEWVSSGEFLRDFWASIWRAGAGLFLGSLGGIGFGLLTGRVAWLNRALSPVLNLLRAFPPVALLPVFITFLGIGNTSKILAIAFACLFPVWVNTHIGASNVPEEYLQSARLMSRSRGRIFFHVVLPASLPWIIGGIRLAIAMSFIMLYVSELAGASSGLGYAISTNHLAYRFDKMFAALFFLGLLAAVSDNLFNKWSKAFFPWLKFTS